MNILSLNKNDSFFCNISSKTPLQNEHIEAALKKSVKLKDSFGKITEVKIEGNNKAKINKTHRIKYYVCRETADDNTRGIKGNKVPWYQISKNTLESLNNDNVEKVVLIFIGLSEKGNAQSYTCVQEIADIPQIWNLEGGKEKYRINFHKNDKGDFIFNKEDKTIQFYNDGSRKLGQGVE